MFYFKTPAHSTIAIYGSGSAGESFCEYITKYRPDVTVVCYVDSFQSGTKNGLPVYKVDQFREIDGVDFVVVCSFLAREIVGVLRYFGVENYIIVTKDAKILPKYYERNKSKFECVFQMLHHEVDKKLYKLLLDYSCDMEMGPTVFHEKIKELSGNKWYVDHINTEKVRVVIDGGSYTGDTANYFLGHFTNVEKIHCFDVQYSKDDFYGMNPHFVSDARIQYNQIGLSLDSEPQFIANPGAGGGIRISKDATRNTAVQCISLDTYSRRNPGLRVDYIKLDVEGAETEVLNGARETIAQCRPQLAISIYHDVDDIWSVPLLMRDLCPDYVFRLGHYRFDLTETVMYAIPKELYLGE